MSASDMCCSAGQGQRWVPAAPMQICYVIPDMFAALEHWTRVVGAGPFFIIENPPFKQQLYRGRPARVEVTAALGFWGDIQIEFITQTNDAPSPYQAFRQAGQSGMHHLGVMTKTLDRDLQHFQQRGLALEYYGETTAGIRFAYVNSDHHPGGLIELIEANPVLVQFMREIREAARDWDGRDPVRRIA